MERLEVSRKRHAFFLAFSHSPVDFIRMVLDSQQRDLEVMRDERGGGYVDLIDKDKYFMQPWVQDAVCKYLHRRIATGYAEGAGYL
mmetsp:Transcript_20856/g.58673  ORF Transcript_20856/g.58673 Transcript_20856/m.58673 type:complete len:86 (+) Transcript_20856:2-259(+)